MKIKYDYEEVESDSCFYKCILYTSNNVGKMSIFLNCMIISKKLECNFLSIVLHFITDQSIYKRFSFDNKPIYKRFSFDIHFKFKCNRYTYFNCILLIKPVQPF